uniref:Uncharacterized protein n=1 Tax=CrAss-like virus sp. ctcfK29 TaxID=2826827 RepID=A0A8S5MJC8_9CAUD|nr:MAG TPA: hypothetical protein [CrAss-like virus sp. ctcfK29]
MLLPNNHEPAPSAVPIIPRVNPALPVAFEAYSCPLPSFPLLSHLSYP